MKPFTRLAMVGEQWTGNVIRLTLMARGPCHEGVTGFPGGLTFTDDNGLVPTSANGNSKEK